jgi:hypothetical protein
MKAYQLIYFRATKFNLDPDSFPGGHLKKVEKGRKGLTVELIRFRMPSFDLD